MHRLEPFELAEARRRAELGHRLAADAPRLVLAALVLDKQVRLGRPAGFHGLPESTGGPAFATCAGLLRYAVQNQAEGPANENRMAEADAGGKLGRLGGWLRKNF